MGIGTLSERSLHAALKEWYARPGDRLETEVDGYFVDIVRGDDLIEIQTGNFTAIRRKLAHLLKAHAVHVVHPVAAEKWIVRVDNAGKVIATRRSPKRGRVADVFEELVAIPQLLMNPNLTIEVLLTKEEAVYVDDGKGSWRRKGLSLTDHRLLGVEKTVVLASLRDFQGMLPNSLPGEFTIKDLASSMPCSQSLAHKMAYTLRHMGAIKLVGLHGRAHVYTLAAADKFLFDPNSQDIDI